MTIVVHGSPTGRRQGCKCEPCQTAHNRACKQYRARRRATGSTLVDATKAARILNELHERMSWAAVGRAVGASHSHATQIARGQVKRITPTLAARIVAARDHRPQDTSHVTALGARRRLQALHALGYTWVEIARHTPGYSLTSVKHLALGDCDVIEAVHHELIRSLYERLAMTLPTTDDQYVQSAITGARKRARNRGWPPPLAYDDIDDPNERPKGVGHQPQKNRPAAELVAEWDHLRAAGVPIHAAAKQLGVSVDAIERAGFRVRKEAS